jgi:outer membrane biosynthesis protein TonB
MKKLVQSVFLGGALATFLSVGPALSAQNTTTPSQSTDAQAQQPATPPPAQAPDTQATPDTQAPSTQTPSSSDSPSPQAQSDMQNQQAPQSQQQSEPTPKTPPDQTPNGAGQTPDNGSQSPQMSAGSQSFTGTIVKSGDKYMFQDAASGNTYDIDHQDQVAKYEGKKVKVHGTLDGKTIRLQ